MNIHRLNTWFLISPTVSRLTLEQKEIITRQKKVNGEIITSYGMPSPRIISIRWLRLNCRKCMHGPLIFSDYSREIILPLYMMNCMWIPYPSDLGEFMRQAFNHVGQELLAIPFTQDSVETYFDADGNSLRRAFLKAPLRFSQDIFTIFRKQVASHPENQASTLWCGLCCTYRNTGLFNR